jgi:spermidine synthase
MIEVGIAVLAYVTMYLYPELPFLYVRLFDQFGVEYRPEALWWVSLLLASLVMTPPAILMGMHFPVAVRAVVGHEKKLGRPVGVIYGINALGGGAGAFLAGFVLLPTLGMQGTILVAAASGLLASGILVLAAAKGVQRRWALVSPLVLLGLAFLFATNRPPWNPLLMTAGMYHYVSSLEEHSREEILRYSVDLYDLISYEEGLSSVVTVAQNRGTPHRWLAINGKVDASTTDDMPTQILLSLLPMQFVEHPDDLLLIGLASGVTAGAAALVPEVERLQVVELEPAIGRAANYFAEWNHSVLSDPRVELVYNDARNHLLLSEPASYDIIVSEPSNPWISGVSNLFTREFFALGKSRLRAGGVWSQWVPIYGMDSRDLRSILTTFGDIYPYVLVYTTIQYNDLVLIGSDSPLQPTEDAARRLLNRPAVASELNRVSIGSTAELVSLFLMNRADIVAMSDGVPINTDDNMYIEYSTSKKLHQESRSDNFALLLEHARLPEPAFDEPDQWARLASSYRQRGDAARAIAALSRAKTTVVEP